MPLTAPRRALVVITPGITGTYASQHYGPLMVMNTLARQRGAYGDSSRIAAKLLGSLAAFDATSARYIKDRTVTIPASTPLERLMNYVPVGAIARAIAMTQQPRHPAHNARPPPPRALVRQNRRPAPLHLRHGRTLAVPPTPGRRHPRHPRQRRHPGRRPRGHPIILLHPLHPVRPSRKPTSPSPPPPGGKRGGRGGQYLCMLYIKHENLLEIYGRSKSLLNS